MRVSDAPGQSGLWTQGETGCWQSRSELKSYPGRVGGIERAVQFHHPNWRLTANESLARNLVTHSVTNQSARPFGACLLARPRVPCEKSIRHDPSPSVSAHTFGTHGPRSGHAFSWVCAQVGNNWITPTSPTVCRSVDKAVHVVAAKLHPFYWPRRIILGNSPTHDVSGKLRRKAAPVGNHFFKLPFDATVLA